MTASVKRQAMMQRMIAAAIREEAARVAHDNTIGNGTRLFSAQFPKQTCRRSSRSRRGRTPCRDSSVCERRGRAASGAADEDLAGADPGTHAGRAATRQSAIHRRAAIVSRSVRSTPRSQRHRRWVAGDQHRSGCGQRGLEYDSDSFFQTRSTRRLRSIVHAASSVRCRGIHNVIRGLANLNVASATLANPSHLENGAAVAEPREYRPGPDRYTTVYQPIRRSTDAQRRVRDMIDMTDATDGSRDEEGHRHRCRGRPVDGRVRSTCVRAREGGAGSRSDD